MIDYFQELLRHAAERPDELVLQSIREGHRERMTYREMVVAVTALASQLDQLGVQAGDRVAILMENDHHWVLAMLGSMSICTITVPLDPSQSSNKLAETVEHAGCRVLFASSAFADHIRAIRAKSPGLEVIEKRNPDAPSAEDSWTRALEAAPSGQWPRVPPDADADCLLVYTGGTTGTPKGVRLSFRAVLVCIQDTTGVFPLSPLDHILSILPLFHIMAIQASALGPLYRGSKITYLISRDPQRIVRAFGEEQVTAFLCVPLFYYQLRRRIMEEVGRQPAFRQVVFRRLFRLSGFLRRNFGWNAGKLFFKPIHARFGPTLRGFGVGGARFAPEVAESLHDLGFLFFQGYGMTETSALSALTPMSLDGGLSCGPAFARAEIQIDNPDAEGVGEVRVRGPHLMTGYWRDDAATAEVMQNGWLRTGDLGFLTADRRLHITGRMKDVIVLSSGKNIFPEPLEQHYLLASPLIAEMAICSLPDARGVSEQLQAVVVPDFVELEKRGIVNIREAILYDLQAAGKSLPPHERLLGFEVRKDPLPRTSARKLQRFRIMEELKDADLQPDLVADSLPDASPTTRQIVEIIRRMKGVHAVTPAMDLELDIGFDSLERVELLVHVQDAFHIKISEERSAGILTVGDLTAAVDALTAGSSEASDAESAEWRSWAEILNDPLTQDEAALATRYLDSRPLAAPMLFLFTRLACLFAQVALRFRFKAAAQGWPERYPFVIAANHQSLLDAPLLMGRVPYRVFRRIFFLSTSRLHTGAFQIWFGRAARAIPIDPDKGLKTALRLAAEGLRRGMVLCVFPEGHRSMDESIQPFRKGLSILAVEQKLSVVPVGIHGTGKVWGRASHGFHLSPVSIHTGSVVEGGDADTHDEFNAMLFAAVKAAIRPDD
ncbi:MAG: AMP-binding protein [Bryobacteraceae bacterium]